MATKDYLLVPLFKKIIKYNYNGKRLKPDGYRIKPQTVNNYVYVLRYLQEYEQMYQTVLRIKVVNDCNRNLLIAERNYWKTFYLQFTDFLYYKKNYYDNYVGTVVKVIRNFFSFLNSDLDIATGTFYKRFYVCREDIPITTLLPEQLHFLITNKAFENSLTKALRKSKDIFVFGCTVALRAGDLFTIRFTDIEQVGTNHYLQVRTLKTGSYVRIKLPNYAIAIVKKFESEARERKTVFPPVPRTRFNNHLKIIARLAGWTNTVRRERSKRGIYSTSAGKAKTLPCYFCDTVSSHMMRRTAITTMLMLGMKEPAVKKISGHADNSKHFYRYVNLVQSYLDNEVDVVFEKLIEMK